MITTTTSPNTTLILYFQTGSGLTVFPNFIVMRDGVLATGDAYTITELASTGIYTLRYTASATGKYLFVIDLKPFAYVDVVTKTILTMVKNLEDESLGSWSWDKVAGTLTMLRQDGTPLANFEVIENLTTASRERSS